MSQPVVVLAGGPSNERGVSLWTAETITSSLTRQGIPHQQIDPRSPDWLSHLKKLRPRAVVLALHGTFGEDGTIQQILEANGLAFTGSGSTAARVTFDKVATKEAISSLGIKTPEWQLWQKDQPVRLDPPVVVKPAREGSSYGITIAWKEHDIEPAIYVAQRYDPQVLIERYVAGTEVTCGVIDLYGQIQALPLVEIRPETEFFDFQAKYDARFCHEICPAEINTKLTERIQAESVRIFQELGCQQYARLDWIISQNQPYFLEVNTLPGMTKTSLITKELATAKIDFDDFLATLIATATKKRHNGKETS